MFWQQQIKCTVTSANTLCSNLQLAGKPLLLKVLCLL